MSAELTITNCAGVASVASLWLFSLGAVSRTMQKWCARLGIACFATALLGVTVALAVRAFEAARFPIANLYESLLLFAWAIIAVFLGIAWRYRRAHFGCVAALVVTAIFLFLSWLPANQRDLAPLMPALVSNWRAVHVPPLLVAYALLLSGGISAIAYLFAAGRRMTAAALALAAVISAASIALGLSHALAQEWLQVFFWGGTASALLVTLAFLKKESQLPVPEDKSISLYDEISHRCITLAFPLLTFGIITGALWANHAWGTYWSWDPKESMSLVTWLSYAVYLHRRSLGGKARDGVAALAVVGLLLALLTYLGFNVLGFGGLHAYGKID